VDERAALFPASHPRSGFTITATLRGKELPHSGKEGVVPAFTDALRLSCSPD
jgi:hypothetical protein